MNHYLSELVGLRNIATDEWQKDYWKSEVNIFFVEFCLTNQILSFPSPFP
jgi:hypothetical protein